MMPRLLRKVLYGILLRQLQAHRLQSGITPPHILQQTQRYYSPRRQNLRDEKRKEQLSGWYDRLIEHLERNECKSTGNLGTMELTVASDVYKYRAGFADICCGYGVYVS
jgi:hypothetical protein